MPSDTRLVERSFSRGAGDYDTARRQLIPCFDAFYGSALAAIPHDRTASIRVLDLGAGTGLLSAQIAVAFPKATLLLTDISEAMLERARERLGGSPRVRFEALDHAGQALPQGFDAVVSSLSIHHLEDPDKAALFRRIHAALRPGGVFVNADQTRGTSAESEHRLRAAWLADVRASGIEEPALEAALARMEHDRNARLADQLAWMAEAGFRDVELWFKQYFFVVYAGRS